MKKRPYHLKVGSAHVTGHFLFHLSLYYYKKEIVKTQAGFRNLVGSSELLQVAVILLPEL